MLEIEMFPQIYGIACTDGYLNVANIKKNDISMLQQREHDDKRCSSGQIGR